MAGDGAVAVAVDDVQWLDAVTARALRYAVRRLDSEPVVVVVTDRTPVASPADVVPPIAPRRWSSVHSAPRP